MVVVFVLGFNNGLLMCWDFTQHGFQEDGDISNSLIYPISYKQWVILPCLSFRIRNVTGLYIQTITLSGFTLRNSTALSWVRGYIAIGV